jgi:hypothetical protein
VKSSNRTRSFVIEDLLDGQLEQAGELEAVVGVKASAD